MCGSSVVELMLFDDSFNKLVSAAATAACSAAE
jgi:hypothetical protein